MAGPRCPVERREGGTWLGAERVAREPLGGQAAPLEDEEEPEEEPDEEEPEEKSEEEPDEEEPEEESEEESEEEPDPEEPFGFDAPREAEAVARESVR